MAKVHVWYAMSGEIVAVGRPSGKSSCLPISGENQNVVELDIEEGLIKELRQTHKIDPLRKVAVEHKV